MVNLKKRVLVLASTVVTFAGMAYGQANCTVVGQAQTLIRNEGTTEQVPAINLRCETGAAGTSVAGSGTLQLFLASSGNVAITSKVLNSSGDTEISARVTAPVALAAGAGAFSAIYPGRVSGSTVTIVFPAGVLPALANSQYFNVNITNIRVNASALPVSTGTPNAITYTGFLSGSAGSINPFAIPSNTLAFAQNGLAATVYNKKYTTGATFGLTNGQITDATKDSGSNSFALCTAYNPVKDSVNLTGVGAGNASVAAGASLMTVVRISENVTTAFKSIAGESSLVASTIASNTVANGTRFQVTFDKVPSNVTLFVPTVVLNSRAAGSVATAQLTSSAAGVAHQAVNPSTDTANINDGGVKGGPLAQVSGTAVFEILTSDDNTQDIFDIPVFLVAKANTVTAGSPAITVTTGLSPNGSTVIPNFAPGATTSNLSSFSACSTSLLFPFVSSQLGFDTGIAISNTSSDPFGTTSGATSKQDGTCALYFYGEAGVPGTVPVITSLVKTGTSNAFLLSSVAPGFQGYMIAKCDFQYAHAYAYVNYGFGSANGLSTSYLAGVIQGTRPANEGLSN